MHKPLEHNLHSYLRVGSLKTAQLIHEWKERKFEQLLQPILSTNLGWYLESKFEKKPTPTSRFRNHNLCDKKKKKTQRQFSKKTEFWRRTPNPRKTTTPSSDRRKGKSELTRNLSSPVESKLRKDWTCTWTGIVHAVCVGSLQKLNYRSEWDEWERENINKAKW